MRWRTFLLLRRSVVSPAVNDSAADDSKWRNEEGRNETPKHKIEKFDVRRFMGVLERSKVARYSSFRGSLYFSFRSSCELSAVDFCCFALSLPACLSLKRNPPFFTRTSSRFFTYLERELPLRHLRNDLSREPPSLSSPPFFVSRIKIYRVFEFSSNRSLIDR